MTKPISVIGAGAWGTALAQVLSVGGKNVTLWARESELVDDLTAKRENTMFLSGVPLFEDMKFSNDLSETVKSSEIILLVPPAQHVRATLEAMKPDLTDDKPVVICSKGIELKTGLLLSRVAEEIIPKSPVAVLSGPSFASELSRGLPSAVTISAKKQQLRRGLQADLGVKHFRPYVTDDIVGAQLGGAIKNVIAIACGIVMGKKLGESARAALLTRGVAEIGRLSIAMGGRRDTLLGMCGVGDLTLTCTSMQSRNYSLGMALGEGESLDNILKTRNSVTEGIYTAEATLALAKKNAVDMPITEAVAKALNGALSIEQAIEEMLNRPFKYEIKTKK